MANTMVATSAGGSAVYCFKAFRCLLQVLPCPTLTRYVSCPSFFLTVKGPFQAAERPLFLLGSKQRTGSPIFRLDSLALCLPSWYSLLFCFACCSAASAAALVIAIVTVRSLRKRDFRDHNKDRLKRPNNQHRQWGPHSHHNIYSHKSHAQQLQNSYQHRQVITNTHKDFKESKDSAPAAHGKDPVSSRTFSKPPDHSQLVCFKCGEIGHIARDCVKINLVQIPSLFDKMTPSPVLRPGKIGNKPVSMFMDSGADISVIARDLLPEDNVQCLPVLAKGFGSSTKPETLQTALFQAGQPLQLLAAVAPRHAMTHPVIIGRHIPGKKVQDDPDQPNQQQIREAGEAGEPTSQVVEERAQDPQPSQEKTAEQLAQQPNLHSADRAHPNQLTPPNLEELDLENLTAAQIAAVQTRAQRRRAQQEKAVTPARGKLMQISLTLPQSQQLRTQW